MINSSSRMPDGHAVRGRIPYRGLRGRDGHPYIAHSTLIDAANVALILERPLLLTGEPGCGKTDFAFVVAHALADLEVGPRSEPEAGSSGNIGASSAAEHDPGKPLECYIRSDTRARDLLYSYDALLRFADGHHGGEAGRSRAGDARNYIELQALGIAFTSPVRRVVLIDEIDKAPRDLPNDLLRELERGTFEIAEIPAALHQRDQAAGRRPVCERTGVALQRLMQRPPGAPKPMVVITSNVERQLPEPFLRRCVFYHIEFPDHDDLRTIVALRFGDRDPPFLDTLVDIFLQAREIPDLVKKPSTAELLDWVIALDHFEPDHAHDNTVSFVQSLDDRARVRHPQTRWRDLLAAGCLFKLREDLETAARWYAEPEPVI